jgi:hypothetical protein
VPVPVLWAYQAAIVESLAQVPVPVLIKVLKSCVYVPEAVIDTGAAWAAPIHPATISVTHHFVNPKFELRRMFFILYLLEQSTCTAGLAHATRAIHTLCLC